ncbi:MAG: formimidoylglutamase [Austwickia sp.]|nr:formimidoylglutamase [Actinomycetota bacterium]MCB1254531.1 formimidoylglutamase [Austwickia sp.]MCO5309967.1 formimidoylglutamase [Austwickia sp.]
MDARWLSTPEDVWVGRVDGDGPEHARWHQVVASIVPQPAPTGDVPGDVARDVALIGFASDEGVRRNHGRPGAAAAPDAIRRALAPLAVHRPLCAGGPALRDAGTIRVVGQDLEGAQSALAEAVAWALDRHRLVVVLGGGHETAYGSFLGRRRCPRTRDAHTGVINLDAHFDLRDAPLASSGTPFLQMARDDAEHGRAFDYTVLGIAASANTRALFERADALDATYLLDRDCQPHRLAHVLEVVDAAIADADVLHLSIDMDVLPAAVAPGVSAPAGYGVPMETALAVCEHIAASGKLAVVDVVEVAPPYDLDGRTARAAARLVSSLVEALPAP